MHAKFDECLIFLSDCFYPVPIWYILEFLPQDLPPTVLPLDLPLMIYEEVVWVVYI